MAQSYRKLLLACAGVLLAAPFSVQAQFYDPGMVNNQANIFLNGEINRITINTGSPRAKSPGTSSPRRPVTVPIENRVEVAALEALRPGLQKQWRDHGEAAAKRWYVGAARRIGTEMGSLVPEYRRRASRSGVPAADNWYISQARMAGTRISQGR